MWVFAKSEVQLLNFVHGHYSLSGLIVKGESKFRVSFIYGPYIQSKKGKLWEEISGYVSLSPELPWILAGDFNSVRSPTERRSRPAPKLQNMNEFNEFIHGMGLTEPVHHNNHMSWCNGNKGAKRMYQRLDRCLIDATTLSGHHIQASYLPFFLSDHAPLLIREGPSPDRKSPRHF